MSFLPCIICTKTKKISFLKNLHLQDSSAEKCHPVFRTPLDMLKFCVPKLNTSTISAKDNICTKCFGTLRICVTFIEQCLEVFNNEKIKEEALKLEYEYGSEQSTETTTVDKKDETNEADTGQSDIEEKLLDGFDSWDDEEKETDVQCDLCKEYFPKDTLKDHITKEHDKKTRSKLICDECGKKFKTLKLLEAHLKDAHALTTFTCVRCGKNFKSFSGFNYHKKLYKDLESCLMKCEKCEKEFKCKTEFVKHMKKVKDAPTCNYETCPVCSQKFSKEEYKAHMSIHPRKICEVCGEGFSNMGAFFRHKISHNEPNQAICPVCGKGFNHSQKLSTHLRYTHEYGERRFLCTRCPKKFFTRQCLDLHLKRHDNIKDIPCSRCDKMFLSKTLLQTHFKAVHLNFRPHTCTQCNKKFARQQHLQKHLETHMKFKARGASVDGIYNIVVENPGLPGKCHHCGRVFKNLNQLKQHIKTVHVRIRRFKCEFCDMRFICKHTQMKHQEKHKDPYYEFRCKICYKRNKSQEELNDHLKKHTKLPFQCKVCNAEFGRSYLLENHMLAEHPNADLHVPQQIMDEALQNVVFIDNKKE